MIDRPSGEQILAGLNYAIMVVDSGDLITRINPAGEALFGTSAKHLIGRKVDDALQFSDPRLNAALIAPDTSLTARGVMVSSDERKLGIVDFDIHPLASGSDWRLISLALMPQDGPILESENHDPSNLAIRAPDILSHEIKNPLAAIRGAAQLLDRQMNQTQKTLTQMIIGEVERVVNLLNRMQTLSSNQPAQTQAVNIHTLIDRARRSIEAATGQVVKIQDKFDPSLPDALVDPDAMMQVLTNLLANAVDATKHLANPEIRIVTRYSFGASLSAQGENEAIRLPIQIMVCDNGPGVPPELEREIFSAFVSTKKEGQGLGLALVKKLMRDMNGRIRYDRENQHEMSRFTLFLPVAPKN
ncbi:GHKL domain-containing protein [Parasphingorhabdus flavimaris]|uniref:histidine kinase n=1 Tax=Parasphingorhabdus flavimaris TaxID=266812 RepID=A0ABX2N2J6_9SPHN|nr:ATP-binding protein [Parasphingorhabdus flavimaris]NVD27897.1 GHKL domain-containing protein [Parasphingorhabdus flavimaris]|tara:strand:+ start:12267 stop:13340 length:1074 start_codon:yes stop_codon:yes gene_type:complete